MNTPSCPDRFPALYGVVQGYSRIPDDYKGEVWIESQVRHLAARVACAEANEHDLRTALAALLDCISPYKEDGSPTIPPDVSCQLSAVLSRPSGYSALDAALREDRLRCAAEVHETLSSAPVPVRALKIGADSYEVGWKRAIQVILIPHNTDPPPVF